MDWRLDATNFLNRLTHSRVNMLITSQQFGEPTNTTDPRRLRTSVRLRF